MMSWAARTSGSSGAAAAAVETQDAEIAGKIEVAAHLVADLGVPRESANAEVAERWERLAIAEQMELEWQQVKAGNRKRGVAYGGARVLLEQRCGEMRRRRARTP
jgi:hypothetical protein